MTEKQYKFIKNARIIGMTLGAAALIMLLFAIFQNREINALNLITLAAIILGFINIALNKPQPPNE